MVLQTNGFKKMVLQKNGLKNGFTKKWFYKKMVLQKNGFTKKWFYKKWFYKKMVLQKNGFTNPQKKPCQSGAKRVDVMITFFCDFCQFSATKLAFFTQNPML
jgi:hypothetical protein